MKPLFITPLLSCFFAASRQPSQRVGRLLFASRLRKSQRFRLICFRPPPSDRRPAWLTLRLCGLPGDTLEIRKGVLYVNGKDADKGLDLIHTFKVDRKDSSNIRHDARTTYTIPPYPDTLYIPLPASYVRENHLPCEQYILPPGLRSDSIYRIYKKNWNNDNFGPVKVPPGRWFALGDDRSHATDSRHFGFIDPRSSIGVVL